MSYVVDKNTCIGCLACIGNCPVEAIVEKDAVAEIDKEKCIECGACASICPVEAIKLDEDKKEEKKENE